jgi:organic radical activating enzyme
MTIKGLVEEDFSNYKKPSMFIIFPYCSFKCDTEAGCTVCQNSTLANEPNMDISIIEIVSRYVKNPITKSIVMGGLEPFDHRLLSKLIKEFRKYTADDIVIYTGYTEEELEEDGILTDMKKYSNIIIKFGRFIPNQEKHYDEVLGVELASPNQYARRIS